MHHQFGMTLALGEKTLVAVEFHRRRVHKLVLDASPRLRAKLEPKLKLLDRAIEDLRQRQFALYQESGCVSS